MSHFFAMAKSTNFTDAAFPVSDFKVRIIAKIQRILAIYVKPFIWV